MTAFSNCLQAAIDEGCFRQSGNVFEGAPDVARILATASEIASAMEYLHTKVGRSDPMKHHGCPAGEGR